MKHFEFIVEKSFTIFLSFFADFLHILTGLCWLFLAHFLSIIFQAVLHHFWLNVLSAVFLRSPCNYALGYGKMLSAFWNFFSAAASEKSVLKIHRATFWFIMNLFWFHFRLNFDSLLFIFSFFCLFLAPLTVQFSVHFWPILRNNFLGQFLLRKCSVLGLLWNFFSSSCATKNLFSIRC